MGAGDESPGSANRISRVTLKIEQAVESARKLEGLADILLMKGSGIPASWESKYEEGPITLLCRGH